MNLEKHDKVEKKEESKVPEVKQDKEPVPVPVTIPAQSQEIKEKAPEIEKKEASPVKEDPVPTKPEKGADSHKGKSRQLRKKPAWALSEKQVEELKEQEADNLIEFAYQLDYEKYIEDFEVRQALASIRERVQELKKDDKWKENFADKWNEEGVQQADAAPVKVEKGEKEEKAAEDDKLETQSVRSGSMRAEIKNRLESQRSTRSKAVSIKSMADAIKEAKETKDGEKPDWDKSV